MAHQQPPNINQSPGQDRNLGTCRYLRNSHESRSDVEVKRPHLVIIVGVPLPHCFVVCVSHRRQIIELARVERRHRVPYRVGTLENCVPRTSQQGWGRSVYCLSKSLRGLAQVDLVRASASLSASSTSAQQKIECPRNTAEVWRTLGDE